MRPSARGLPFMMLALAALLGGCKSEERDVENAVRRYNELLIEAYRANDGKIMREIAWEEEVVRIIVLADLKRSNDLVLENTLEFFKVLRHNRIEEGTRTVDTEERWRYYDRPLKPGIGPFPEVVARMELRYTLQREGEIWKVKKLEATSHEYLEGGPDPSAQEKKQDNQAADVDHTKTEE